MLLAEITRVDLIKHLGFGGVLEYILQHHPKSRIPLGVENEIRLDANKIERGLEYLTTPILNI